VTATTAKNWRWCCTIAAPAIPSYWARLDAPDLGAAREMLRRREKIRPEYPQCVGSIPNPHGAVDAAHRRLDARQELDAVVWTALPAKFAGVSQRAPSAHEALAFLAGLEGEVRAKAEEYVRRIPPEIDTLYRSLIADKLGWTHRLDRFPRPLCTRDGAMRHHPLAGAVSVRITRLPGWRSRQSVSSSEE
jgi:hypothetical protein